MCAPFSVRTFCAPEPRWFCWPWLSPCSSGGRAIRGGEAGGAGDRQRPYKNIPELRKAVTDASAIASALRGIGFSVLVAQNQDRPR